MNDQVRVYKGGSWKDRAYWLSPGERRYLIETEARDDLGIQVCHDPCGNTDRILKITIFHIPKAVSSRNSLFFYKDIFFNL